MKNKGTKFLAQSALIAALYTAITLLFAPIAFGAVQFRISEALVVLPFFTPAAIPGVTLGCLLSNLLAGGHWLDIVFGSLATLLGALGSYWVRKYPYAVPVPPIIANTVIIPWVLRYAYGSADLIPWMMLTVGVGEILAAGVLGILLLKVLQRCGFEKIIRL